MADNNGLFQQLLEQYKTAAVPSQQELDLQKHLADLQTHVYDEPQADDTKTALAKGLLALAPMLAGVAVGGARAGAEPGIAASQALQASWDKQAKERYKRQQGRAQAQVAADRAQLSALQNQRKASITTAKDIYETMNKQGTLEESTRHHKAMESNASLGKSEAVATKEQKYKDKRLQDMVDRMTPARRNPLLTKLQTQVNQADALEALAVNNGKIASLNPQQQVEAARMLDSLLSQGGQATVAITNELVPPSVGRTSANILQWITNHPQDAHAQKYTEYLLNTARREREVRQFQLKKTQAGLLPQYKDVKENDPDRYYPQLHELGFVPEDFNDKGEFVGAPTSSSTTSGTHLTKDPSKMTDAELQDAAKKLGIQ